MIFPEATEDELEYETDESEKIEEPEVVVEKPIEHETNVFMTENIITGLAILIIIIAGSFFYIQERYNENKINNAISSTLKDNETRIYTIAGIKYEVHVVAILGEKAAFDINGERFNLGIKKRYRLLDGTMIVIKDIFINRVEFFLGNNNNKR